MIYQADMMDGDTGQGGCYEFDGADDLMKKSPVKVVKAFMDFVDKEKLPREHIDYEIFSALKNKEHQVVTCMGNLVLEHGEIPFLLMISPKAGDA